MPVPLGANGQGWPSNRLPTEVFQIIAKLLDWEDVTNTRLVCREFEKKISEILFKTVVVPFRDEIYGMMIEGAKNGPSKLKHGQAVTQKNPDSSTKLFHDGMKVFQAWGPHINHFAMAFEINEKQLASPPMKGRYEDHVTFWGSYQWPHPQYRRFESCEALEKKADESRAMSLALSFLTKVTNLALSVNSGLGFINGPDISDRARLFHEPTEIFGKKFPASTLQAEAREVQWQAIRDKAYLKQSLKEIAPARACKNHHWLALFDATSNCLSQESRRLLRQARPLIFEGVDIEAQKENGIPGYWSTSTSGKDDAASTLNPDFKPAQLQASQLEWLLENEWAQRAFMSSFCMALSDNTQTFKNVKSLTFSMLSSRYLSLLDRDDVWKGLGNLATLKINVIADWRDISKLDSGFVVAPALNPSAACEQFYMLLLHRVAHLETVKTLEIGFIGGGEHQPGIFGRNKNVLPAPICNPVRMINSQRKTETKLVLFKQVEGLTFSNCWFSPNILKSFVQHMSTFNLKDLVLNSVSLSATDDNGIIRHQIYNWKQFGIHREAQGSPRRDDPLLGNFFGQRPADTPEPNPDKLDCWVNQHLRIGSWGEVINTVTPGPDLDMARYAFHFYDREFFEGLPTRPTTKLERIVFKSCGMVRLALNSNPQEGVLNVAKTAPKSMENRARALQPFVMHTPDVMCGQIVPQLEPREVSILESGFGMTFGWGHDEAVLDAREDGQPLGGTGRFSGTVERLRF